MMWVYEDKKRSAGHRKFHVQRCRCVTISMGPESLDWEKKMGKRLQSVLESS